MARTLLHRTVFAAFVLLVGTIGGLAIIALGAPAVGYEAVIVRGASMAPALPIGALALVDRAATDPRPGSIVTVRRESGVLVTHRVVRVIEGEPRLLELKGDRNEHPDAHPVPGTAVVGTVTGYLPLAGFLAFLIRQPTGLLATLSLLASLLLAARLLEPDAGPKAEPDSPPTAAPDRLPPAAHLIGAVVLGLCLLTGGLGAPSSARAAFGSAPSDGSTFSTAASW
jgi:signal peptidase I